MFEIIDINHHIQKYILSILQNTKYARFRDMRPPRVDTNLYSYHLKSLISRNLVTKAAEGYTLGLSGLSYVDRITSLNTTLRLQPKIVSMLLIENLNGQVLLSRRNKQPFINCWSLPYGKVHLDDQTVRDAGLRESKEKLGVQIEELTHVGNCSVRIDSKEGIVSSMYVNVFRAKIDESSNVLTGEWFTPESLETLQLAPATKSIIHTYRDNEQHIFSEFNENWSDLI